MGSDVWSPDVLVGIDFGMTCTGIAFSQGPDWPAKPTCIDTWPGLIGNDTAHKVPTRVGYNDSGQVQSWGMEIDPDEELQVEECFKLYLDSSTSTSGGTHVNSEEARRYFKDYMTCIFNFVQTFFVVRRPRWETEKVEFLFSIPTTWRNPRLTNEIERLIKEAGFGRNKSLHRISIATTEAEAAAVSAAKGPYLPGDVILVCDAGGGTTDVNILKKEAAAPNKTQLKAFSTPAEGRNIGSVLIDRDMEHFLATTLASLPAGLLPKGPEVTAQAMMKGRFERFKCAFGSDHANVPTMKLKVHGLERHQSFEQLDITDGMMTFKSEKLRELFDHQVERMFQLIDEQILSLQAKHPNERISHLVLSGGLGSSPYVRKRLQARYETNAGSSHANAQDMRILMAADHPQLAVVQGLVMNRTQEINQGTPIYKDRCCRVSYGVECREQYDPIKHRGEPVVEDIYDGKRWAEHQVHWLIKQGQTISEKGISVPYKLKIPFGKELEKWKAQIVMSSLNPEHLPTSMRHEGVKKVCQVESMIDVTGMKVKKPHLQLFSKPEHRYTLAEFDIKVIVGPADLKFQLCSKDGRIFSNDHNQVEAEWDHPDSDTSHGENMGMMWRSQTG